MGLKKLNRRHQDFCFHYAVGDRETRGNGAQSYIKAGYNCEEPRKRAHDLLQEPLIKEKIQDYYRQLDITNEAIVAEYLKILTDDDARNADKRAVLADLAKIKGMMIDKQEVTTKSELVDDVIHSLSTDKVVKIA